MAKKYPFFRGNPNYGYHQCNACGKLLKNEPSNPQGYCSKCLKEANMGY